MSTLRLVADDLTGALDTGAEFVGVAGPVPVYWAGAIPPDLPASAALDSGTRERSEAEAVAIMGRLAPVMVGGSIAYKKVDSLLRGHTMAEFAACFRLGAWRHGVVAPAFPYQGRITRDGQQFSKGPEGWSPVSGDLLAELAAQSLPVHRGRWDALLPVGVNLFDAQTHEDLERVAAIGRRADGPVLWCGSGGLARALTRGTDPNASDVLQPPVLGLFGSDQAVTARQLAACGKHWLKLPDGGAQSAARVSQAIDRSGVALASLDLPPGLARAEAAAQIRREMEILTRCLAPPGTLIVAGGETLRALCISLGADALEVRGQIMPGLPRSVLSGGRWSGVEIVSKSGAFGEEGLWHDLLDRNGVTMQRADT